MWNKKKTTHWAFLGALCGGLLLMGIGAGIQLAEISALSYGGEILMENTTHTQRMVLSLSPHAEFIHLKSEDESLASQLRELHRIEVEDSVDPGTAVVEVQYEGIPVEFTYDTDTDQVPLLQAFYFSWFNDREVSTLMAYKDMVLEDLKLGQLSDYKLWQLREVTIRVNPADADRISVS